jgi:uncharacterized membrane protein YjgN (DUF898 family)
MDQISSVPPRTPPTSVVFSGIRSEFRRLVTRGAGLELVTFGFYRFWLATDIRRHLWSNTDVDGDAAEYTGRGRELLVGFLFALAILVPIYLVYFLIGIELERYRAFASFPLFLFFYLFGQFAIYRARRYRLTRTVWRGVRFWMSGSGWAYASWSALWSLLALFTLGLALPWREAALERYKMRHSYYGDLQGRFEGRGWEFFKRGWWLWLSAIGALIAVAIMLARKTPGGPVITLVLFLLVPFLYGAFKAIEWRWWLSGIRFGEVRFESNLRRTALIGLYWKVIGWFLLIMLLFSGYEFLCVKLIAAMNQTPAGQVFNPANLQGNIPMIVMTVAGYLALILALNVVMRVYLLRDVWARVIASVGVHHIEAASNVTAKGDLANALGEGLADGLDVAGF